MRTHSTIAACLVALGLLGCASDPAPRSRSTPAPSDADATPPATSSRAGPGASFPSAPRTAHFDWENDPPRLAQSIAACRADEIFALFGPNLRSALPLGKLRETLRGIRRETGELVSVGEAERAPGSTPEQGALRLPARFAKEPFSFEIHFIYEGGLLDGLMVRPAQETKYDQYDTRARLSPPFRGTWTARNAARRPENPHYCLGQQRFAVDWLIVGESGKTFKTDGRKNDDYYCYGQPILAPADGTVVVAIDGIWENDPSDAQPVMALGNCVAMDLGDGEFAWFMHLQPRSLRVKVGDRIRSGAEIGRCGNSGRSTEPHLHFQLTDSSDFPHALSIPAKFTHVTLNGNPCGWAWPDENDQLAPAP